MRQFSRFVALVFVAVFLTLLMQQHLGLKKTTEQQSMHILVIEKEMERQESIIQTQIETIQTLQKQIETLESIRETMQEFFQVEEFEITAYAPLDPQAIEGMCYSGDPRVTRTGATSTPGRTIAVDPKVIPFSTPVYIEGIGWRIAEDTGGAIKGNKIDVMVETRKEAFAIGRQTVRVVRGI